MTYVTCPIMRYHPAVVAQKAATVALLSDGRFTLGLGAGENLNEHVVGGAGRRPTSGTRCSREAVEIIRALFDGETSTSRRPLRGRVRQDLGPAATPPPIGVAVSGRAVREIAGRVRATS